MGVEIWCCLVESSVESKELVNDWGRDVGVIGIVFGLLRKCSSLYILFFSKLFCYYNRFCNFKRNGELMLLDKFFEIVN